MSREKQWKKGMYDYFGRGIPAIEDFEEARALHDSVKPIKGRKLDTRPVGERRYPWEQITKISDDEYSVAFSVDGRYWGVEAPTEMLVRARQGISFMRDGAIRIYSPAYYEIVYNKERTLTGKAVVGGFGNPEYNLYDSALPSELGVLRYHSKPYVTLPPVEGEERRFYLIPKEGYLEIRKDEGGAWQAVNPVQETKQVIDREKSRPICEKLREIANDAEALLPMVEDETTAKYLEGEGADPQSTRYQWYRKRTLRGVVLKKKIEADAVTPWDAAVVGANVLPGTKSVKDENSPRTYTNGRGETITYYPYINVPDDSKRSAKGIRELLRRDVYKVKKPVREVAAPVGTLVAKPRYK